MAKTAAHTIPSHDSAFAGTVREFCRRGFKPAFGRRASEFPSNPVWAAVRRLESELWLDTGDVEEARSLWCREFSALTTNNTLLNKEVQKGTYDELIPRAAEMLRKADRKMSDDDVVYEIAFILNAVHGLKLVETFDAFVSVEEHTDLARNLEAAVEYGKRFHAICPERFYVKLPFTADGCLAARRLSDAGIPVNFTLGFSARENYLIALVARPTFVNVFMGRLNQFAVENGLGDGRNVGERATLASQRVVQSLRATQPGLRTRQIGASMRSGRQVADLAGLDVLTIPTKAAKEFVDLRLQPEDVQSGMNSVFDVTWGPEVDPVADRFDVLWEVPEALGKAVCRLYGEDLSGYDGEKLADLVREAGVADLFPVWTPAERERITADGKIPKYAAWREEARKGRVGWDALFSESALLSFATDQKALDERIRRVVRG